MQTAISSTEVVRNFSELLNNIKYRGDRYTVIRGGKPAASLIPLEVSRAEITLSALTKIVRSLPHLDSADSSFEADVIESAKSQPSMPTVLSWE